MRSACISLSVLLFAIILPVYADIAVRGVPATDYAKFQTGIDCVPRDPVSALAGSVHIPLSQINDNYCDCKHGEDEPGTSACNLGQFWCINIGSKGRYIHHSWVDDGHCDCCDGSDEPSGICPNICQQEGQEARKAAKSIANMIMRGAAKRAKYAEDGKRAKANDVKRLKELKVEIGNLQPRLQRTREQVNELNRLRELADRLQSVGSSHNDPTPASAYMDESDEHDVSGATGDQRLESAEPQEREHDAHAEENLLQPSSGDTDPNDDFHDDMAQEHENDNAVKENFDGETIIGTSDEKERNNPNPDNISSDAVELDSLCAELNGRSRNILLRNLQYYYALLYFRILRSIPKFGRTDLQQSGIALCTQRAQVAQNDLVDKKHALEKEVAEIETRLSLDFGEDEALRNLKGSCVKQKLGQYEYELCHFDKVVQYEHDSAIATLGTWSGWETGNRDKMVFKNGDHCWNGPSRSIKIFLSCGENEQIVSVDEPSRCVYNMQFNTPTSCRKEQADAIMSEISNSESGDREQNTPITKDDL